MAKVQVKKKYKTVRQTATQQKPARLSTPTATHCAPILRIELSCNMFTDFPNAFITSSTAGQPRSFSRYLCYQVLQKYGMFLGFDSFTILNYKISIYLLFKKK